MEYLDCELDLTGQAVVCQIYHPNTASLLSADAETPHLRGRRDGGEGFDKSRKPGCVIIVIMIN
jgi:hypothetical protein